MDATTRLNALVQEQGYDFQVTENLITGEFHTLQTAKHKVWVKGVRINGRLVVWIGDWRNPDKKIHFVEDAETLDSKGLRDLNKFNKQVQKDREEKQLQAKAQVEELFARWTAVADQSDYLRNKKLSPSPGVKVRLSEEDSQKILVVPMQDDLGELWNVQQLYKSGKKVFHAKARTKGLFHEIAGNEECILLGEGYATCLAAHTATGYKAYAAFSVKNLEHVLNILLKRFEAGRIVLLADWDAETFQREGINPGMLEAQKLTAKYNIRVAIPGDVIGVNIDFADVFAGGSNGPALCRDLIEKAQGLACIQDREFKVDRPKLKTDVSDKVEDVDHDGSYTTASSEPQVPTDSWFRSTGPMSSLVPAPDAAFPTKTSGFFFEHYNEKGGVRFVPDFEGFSSYLGKNLFLKTNDAFNYLYDDNYYKQATILQLKQLAHELLKKNIPPGAVSQFVEHARAVNFVPIENLTEPEGLINLKNGVLNVRTRELYNHGPEYFFKYKLPHEYIEGAECPRWLEYLDRTFEGNQDLVDVCAEIFGYILLGGNPFLHKAIVLSGEGRNGKSTFLDVLKYMIGKANFSSIPVGNLDRPFSVIMADGKLANVVGETSTREINSEAFKMAVGGEELIAAQKGCPEYAMPFNARIVMACNKLPHLGDATTGTHEKFFILPFNRYLQASERTVMFAQRVLFPEIAGVIQWSLGGLERLLKRGMLPEIGAVKEQGIELREEIDSVFAWWREHVRLGEDVNLTSGLQFKNYFENYVDWCEKWKRPTVSALTFSKRCMAEVRKHPNLTVSNPHNVKSVSGRIAIDVKRPTVAGLPY